MKSLLDVSTSHVPHTSPCDVDDLQASHAFIIAPSADEHFYRRKIFRRLELFNIVPHIISIILQKFPNITIKPTQYKNAKRLKDVYRIINRL